MYHIQKKYSNCIVNVYETKSRLYVVNGKLIDLYKKLNQKQNLFIKYWAANPPNSTNNVSNINIPFPNKRVAFQNTINKGVVKIIDGNFKFELLQPYCYYTDNGVNYVQPNVKFIICDNDNIKCSPIYTIYLRDYENIKFENKINKFPETQEEIFKKFSVQI